MSDASVKPDTIGKPAPSRAARWLVLGAIGILCYGGYYAFDYIGALAPLLNRQLHFSNTDIGFLQAVYSLPNIIAMLVCGVIIDRLGTRKSLSIFGVLIFAGLVVTALSQRLGVMAAGRLLVGSGGEALALAANVAVARWFWHDELSLAFGLRASAARLGSLSAQVSPAWAPRAYTYWRWPLLLGVGFGGFCVLGSALYWILDVRSEPRFTLGHTPRTSKISFGEIFRFNRSFWLIALLCLTFYGCIFPFETFGQKFLIEARHVTPQTASLLVGMEPLFSLVGMPLFGLLVDRHAHRSLLMMFGSLLIVPVFPMLGFTNIPPAIPMAMMGVAFALVPAVMWPALVYVVDKSRLGLANGMLDTVQQLGLVVINLLIGFVNDRWLASEANAAGYHVGLLIFTGIAVLAVLSAFALWRLETGPAAHGLETITARQ
ncbi:MAG TPA: MFS transporter [Candidatus Acidoferrales bacterium]|nr:MFS transporter [Candidatus Acidoferrales bacterium]